MAVVFDHPDSSTCAFCMSSFEWVRVRDIFAAVWFDFDGSSLVNFDGYGDAYCDA